jgi:HK97 family phage major capsid protein
MKQTLYLGALGVVAALLILGLIGLPNIAAAARAAARLPDRVLLWGGMHASLLHAGILNATGASAKRLKERRAAVVAEMRTILDTADGENRDLTAEEQTQYDALEQERTGLITRIERTEALDTEERALAASGGVAAGRQDEDPGRRSRGGGRREPGHTESREFQNAGEFLFAVRFRPDDARLQYVDGTEERDREGRAMSMGTDTAGGFMVPEEFRETLLSVEPQDAIVEPRATVIPAGDSPDAKLRMPALDQFGVGQNIYGGVVVDWIAEGTTKPLTNGKLRDVEIVPHEVAGRMEVTDKLLRNWRSANAVIEKLFRGALIAAKDDAFINGDGVDRPLGILAADATLLVPRLVADQISFADVVALYGRIKMGGPLTWITTQEALPQLMTMEDSAGHLIWLPSGRDGSPGTLLGIEVKVNERSPRLGDLGDLTLANLPYYLVKEGVGPLVSASPHEKFSDNKTVIKAFLTVGGKPWLNGPITLENGYQVSPFVALDVPEV